MEPKPLPYLGRLQKAQRLAKSALYRHDAKLAVRELCESLDELMAALIEHEQGPQTTPAQNPPGAPPL